mmetsp:Transcript_43996/g.72724  ORF Transcript_43996/g.72724 Transcript_43996/m.72724 type:complete len:310 (-) Transcript_43996:204-1133(-)
MATEEEACALYWSNAMGYPLYAVPICFGLALLSLLPFVVVFIKAFYAKEIASREPRLFYLSLTFFIVICVFYLTAAMYHTFWCSESVSDGAYYAMSITTLTAYPVQGKLLCLNLFFRLMLIFKDSVYALSKCTKVTFVTVFVVGILLDAIVTIFLVQRDGSEIEAMFFALASILYIFLVIWLNALFAYKLIKVHQTNEDTAVYDRGLVYLAIKASLLCFISTCSIFIFLIGSVLDNAGLVGSPHLTFVVVVVFSVCDLHTNFFSVLLTFKYFEPWYKKSCGRCCHDQCNRICLFCSGKKHAPVDVEMEE